MGKTSDLAMVQKTVIDALHKEGKSQRGILKGVALHRVLDQSIFNAKLTGRKNLDRKRCTSNRDDLKLEIQSSKADSNTWESFIRSGLKLESTSEASYLGCGEKITGLLLSSPKFLFSDECTFWKSRSQSLEEDWRGTESMLLEVQCEVSTVSDDLGCHVICWCWSSVFSEVHSQRSHLPGNFSALHASFC